MIESILMSEVTWAIGGIVAVCVPMTFLMWLLIRDQDWGY